MCQGCTVNFWCFLWRLFKMEFLGSKDEFHEPPKWERMEIFGGFSISFFESKSRELLWGPQKNNCGTVGVAIFVGGPHKGFWRTSKSLNHSNSVSLLSNPPTSLPQIVSDLRRIRRIAGSIIWCNNKHVEFYLDGYNCHFHLFSKG